MATTVVMDLPATWTELAAGQLDVLVQLRTIGVAEIFVGAAAPADNTSQHGVVIDSGGGDGVFSGTGFTASDNVYGRSLSGETERVAVITAPQVA